MQRINFTQLSRRISTFYYHVYFLLTPSSQSSLLCYAFLPRTIALGLSVELHTSWLSVQGKPCESMLYPLQHGLIFTAMGVPGRWTILQMRSCAWLYVWSGLASCWVGFAALVLTVVSHFDRNVQGPDLQNILRQSYDYLTIMPKLRSTNDGRQIHKTSYEGREVFLTYDSLAKL